MRSSINAFLFAVVTIVFIYLGEGAGGFRPFLNLEALLLVCVGLAAFLLSAYSLREVLTAMRCGFLGAPAEDPAVAAASAEVLSYAAAGAVKVSILGTIFALMLVLSSMERFDAGILARRLALVLDVPFFGYFLASMVFTPMSRRLSRHSGKP